MLTGLKILIAEDEPIIAMELAIAVEALEGIVIGPVPTVAEALVLLSDTAIAAAIVDANLADCDVTPLALRLIELHVPLVVHTGKGLPIELLQSHPELPVVMKPSPSEKVVEALLSSLGDV